MPLAPPPGPRGSPAAPLVTGHDLSFRMTATLSTGGTRVRLRLSNELGTQPVSVGTVEVALADAAGEPLPGSSRRVTFGGAPRAIIPAWAPLESDPVPLAVRAGATLLVSLHVPGEVAQLAMHPLSGAETRMASGDQAVASRPFADARRVAGRVLLSGIDADGPAAGTVVTLGDSITDGREGVRWSEMLAARLARDGRVAVANAGISGNRLLSMGTGQPALARLDRDVLAVPGARWLVLLEGINDIGGATRDGVPPPRPATIVAAYRQVIERAHARGIKVIGATLPPYRGAFYYAPEGDAVRREVNAWIRAPGHFDGVIDFERALADPADPGRLAAAFDSGDHLHPSDEGYRRMGAAIDLRLFR